MTTVRPAKEQVDPNIQTEILNITISHVSAGCCGILTPGIKRSNRSPHYRRLNSKECPCISRLYEPGSALIRQTWRFYFLDSVHFLWFPQHLLTITWHILSILLKVVDHPKFPGVSVSTFVSTWINVQYFLTLSHVKWCRKPLLYSLLSPVRSLKIIVDFKHK